MRRMMAGAALLSALVGCWLLPCSSRAADPQVPFRIPPAPNLLPPRWFLEFNLTAVAPTDTDGLCPEGSGCVYSGGAGVGATAENRWPTGWGAFVAYDIWFIDSESVYELGVQQSARGGARYTWPNATIAHPVAELGGGLTAFGDTFRFSTVGVLVQGMLGLELELSRHFGVLGGFGLRAFSHSRFRTGRDDVARGRGEIFSQALFLHIGLTVNGRPWATAEP
jgi:hypothetical protein